MSDPRPHDHDGAHVVGEARRPADDSPARDDREGRRVDRDRRRDDHEDRSGDHRGARRPAADADDRRDVLAREKAEFGGMRFFLAFFGWLAATGTVVLLTAVVTGVLALIGVQTGTSAVRSGSGQAVAAAVGIAVLAFVLFVGYYVGGYVAGRMARFSGLKQGLAVWLWAVIVAVLAAVAAAVAGSSTGAFSQLSTAGLPISGAGASATGIWSLIVAIVFSLLGALVGGLGGMRFHRKVDRFARNA